MPKSIGDALARRAASINNSKAELPDDKANRTLDRDFDAQFCLTTQVEDVVLVAINRLRPFSKHPFKSYDIERLSALAESIERDGLQQPVILRDVENVQGFEILAGHNRVAAMQKLGRRDIPAIIRTLDDDAAALVVVNTNLKQRDKLLPSEKAFAYKLQMEALQSSKNATVDNGTNSSDANGLRSGAQFGHLAKSRDIIAESNGVDRHEIQRYIRLTFLLPELLELLDQSQYPIMAGYEISFLNTDAQQAVLQYFFHDGAKDKLSLKNAEIIRAAYESKKQITEESIYSILHKPKRRTGPLAYKFSYKDLKKAYVLPDNFDFEAFVHDKLREAYGSAHSK